jgi:hypothetical protein
MTAVCLLVLKGTCSLHRAWPGGAGRLFRPETRRVILVQGLCKSDVLDNGPDGL